MLVVHATKKLLDRVGTPTVEPTTGSSTVLGSWYATVLFWRPQVALDLSEVPTSPLYQRHVSPDRELAAVVAEAP